MATLLDLGPVNSFFSLVSIQGVVLSYIISFHIFILDIHQLGRLKFLHNIFINLYYFSVDLIIIMLILGVEYIVVELWVEIVNTL